MATVDKTWVFLSDNEGLADAGTTPNITVNHDTAGNPGGSLEFGANSFNATSTEQAQRATTGETWETWGVPAGATVTSVQIISGDYQVWSASFPTSETVNVRIIGSGGGSVHSAGDILAKGLTLATGSWQALGSGTARAVDSGSQPSTTDVRLVIEMVCVNSSNTLDTGIDNVLLRITYTPAAGGVVAPERRYLAAIQRAATR